MRRGRIFPHVGLAALVLAVAPLAAADPTPTESASPRSVGRAGIGTVSEDSGLASLVNPAGLARRGQPRLVLGLRLVEIDTTIDSTRLDGEPRVVDQATPRVIPALGYAHGIGERLVLAVAVVETTDHRRTYSTPQFGQPPEDVEPLFPTRYAGLDASASVQSASLAAAFRANDWLALGAGVIGSRHTAASRRAVWAGFSGRDIVGAAERDLHLELEASTAMAVGGIIGLLAAPIDIPIEIAASVHMRAPHEMSGSAALRRTTDLASAPAPGPAVDATLERPGLITARAGVRYLRPRITLELGGVAAFGFDRRGTNHWSIDELEVTDESGARSQLSAAPVLVGGRQRFAVGGAIDVAVVEGFLWLTGGYAFRSAGVSPAERNPLLVSPTGHRLAIGAEAVWSQFSISLGLAHELAPTTTVSASGGLPLLNPFGAGTGPAAAGHYQHQSSFGALTIEVAFD